MAPREILPGLFFIERGLLNANHFVYRGDAPVLIDSGYIGGFEETARRIAETGVDLRRVARIISTHTHCDHIGGNRRIQEMSGCDIALHRVGKHFIDTRDDWSTWWRYYHQEADFFDCTQTLEEGEDIFVGPHRFEVIYTPGHAADGIVLYHPDKKLLLSSDTLWENDMAVLTIRIEGSRVLLDVAQALQRLASLDVQWVFPGHGRPFKDIYKALERSRKKLAFFMEEPRRIGESLLRKIIIYTLLMKQSVPSDGFLTHLMTTHWFPETVDFYFNGQYDRKYHEIMESFLSRGIVLEKDGGFETTVKP